MMGHGMWRDLGGGWGGPFEWLWALLGLAATVGFWIVVVVLLVKLLKNRPFTGPGRSSAMKVLEERYARGEIDRDEYFERRAVLSGEGPPA